MRLKFLLRAPILPHKGLICRRPQRFLSTGSPYLYHAVGLSSHYYV